MPLLPAHKRQLAALTPGQRERLRTRLRARTASGFALVAEALQQSGVRYLCGMPGTPVDALFHEVAERGLQAVATRHQTSAVIAAAAANHLSGQLEAFVVVSAGPAVTNTTTGLLVARDNGWPVVVMGGRRPLANEGAGYFQELDAVPALAPLTKWAATVERTEDLMPMVHRAAEIALSGTPGPVYLDLPEDVLYGEAHPSSLGRPVRTPPPAPAETEVDEALALLRASERPLLALGEGLWWDVAPDTLRQFVDREGLPFITTSLGRGLVPDAHPLCLNGLRQVALPESDLVLMAGAWFDYRFQRGGGVAPGTRVIHVEPDVARRGRNVTPTLAVAASPGLFLDHLAAQARGCAPIERPAWKAAVIALRASSEATVAPVREGAESPLQAQQLYAALRDTLPEDAVVVLEGSIHMAAGHHGLRVNWPRAWLDSGWNGCMGAGLPMALGARLAFPTRPIVAVVGDTGMGLSGMEIETAVRHNLPVVLVVANNGGINGAQRQETFLGDHPNLPVLTYSEGLRYDRVSRDLGADGIAVDRAEDLAPAFRTALSSGRTTCVDVAIDPFPGYPRFW